MFDWFLILIALLAVANFSIIRTMRIHGIEVYKNWKEVVKTLFLIPLTAFVLLVLAHFLMSKFG